MEIVDIKNIKWNKKSYKEFIKFLKSLENIKYKEFHSKLINTNLNIIGIRVPIMRKIAKEILKTDVEKFFSLIESKYYEEVFIEGIVLSSSSEEIIDKYLMKFINKIDNWAICDSFCISLKIVNKKLGKYWIYFTSSIDLEKEFQTRVGLVIMLNYYLIDNYIDRVLYIVSNIKSEKYYINMAISWLLSVAIIKYPDKVIELLKSKTLSKFIQNKTISKINDSYRVDDKTKDFVRKFIIV